MIDKKKIVEAHIEKKIHEAQLARATALLRDFQIARKLWEQQLPGSEEEAVAEILAVALDEVLV